MKIYYNNNRRLYYWGLLGIIPVAGAITGVILIYKAFTRKDKLLAIIGLIGVLITPCFYYVFLESSTGRTLMATNSYTYINDLASEIEFYKLKKGRLPDNLQELKLFNNHAQIYDPLTMHPFVGHGKEYGYKKMGDKYLLFSSGIDGVPNTKDDIYPGLLDYGDFKYSYIKK